MDLTSDSDRDRYAFCEAVQSIPATTYSQILRALDPFRVATEIDSAPGIRISYSVAVYTPLGELVNKWGIKVLYVKILRRLSLLQQARSQAFGNLDPMFPLVNDYKILLRYAGATGDVLAARQWWYQMHRMGYNLQELNADLYVDFLKARYLTEALYASHDLSRLRLRPVDLHRATLRFPYDVVKKLHHLYESVTERRLHRFGQNPNIRYFAEPLTRELRPLGPFTRLLKHMIRYHLIAGNEEILCALLKAVGRTGRVAEGIRLLRDCININIVPDQQTGAFTVEITSDIPAPGYDRPPTALLLDAVVHCFGSMGEIKLAVQLVDLLARRYSIVVPDSVWSDLLDYARITQVKLASQEWKISGLRETQRVDADTIMDIWTLCTQEPYNFKPRMKDYFTITKVFIAEHASLSKPLDAMRRLKDLHGKVIEELCDAYRELLVTTKLGVPNHGVYRRYRVAESNKHYIYHCFNYTSYQMLKTVKPGLVNDTNAVRLIPELIGEFGPFMSQKIKYRIATGIVEFTNDAAVDTRTTFTNRTVEVPELVDFDAMDGSADAEPRTREKTPQLDDFAELDVDREMLGKEDESSESEPTRDYEALQLGRNSQELFRESLSCSDAESEDGFADELPSAEQASAGDGIPASVEDRYQQSSDHRDDFFDDDDEHLRETDLEVSGFAKVPSATNHQLIERPAYMHRPPFTAPEGKPSIVALQRAGKEFKGYPDDPLKRHFAAHRLRLSLNHATGKPVDLGGDMALKKMVEHVLLLKTK